MDREVAQKVDRFFNQYPLHNYAKGQIIIFANERPEHIYYLVSGKVKSYDISYNGDEVILNLLKPPAFFPMGNALNGTDNLYFFEAEEDTQIRCAPPADAVAFLKSNPDVALDLLSRLYRGIDGLLGRVSHLMASGAHSRVLYELVLESKRFGQPYQDGAIKLTVTEKDIASRAGLSRETVNRELHKLKQDKLISVSRQAIVIISLEKISQRLSQEL